MAMTDEQRLFLERLLAKQLKGLMFHFDMALLYHLFGNQKFSKMHLKQALEETKKHSNTNCAIINEYGEIVKPEVDTTRVRISNSLIVRKPTEEEISGIHKRILQTWEKWETDFCGFVESGKALFPEWKMLDKMQRELRKEITSVKKFLTTV